MRIIPIADFFLAATPVWAETATAMAYSDKPFQDNYTQTVLDPHNKKGDAGGR